MAGFTAFCYFRLPASLTEAATKATAAILGTGRMPAEAGFNREGSPVLAETAKRSSGSLPGRTAVSPVGQTSPAPKPSAFYAAAATTATPWSRIKIACGRAKRAEHGG